MLNNENSINEHSKLYGFIAENAVSQRYAVVLNKLYKNSGFNAMMIPMNIREDDILFTLSQMRESKLNGALIASEYQEDAMSVVDFASSEAKELGYVDVVFIRDKKLYGDVITQKALLKYSDSFDSDVALNSICQYFYDITTGESDE